ncbi:hypothetical protein E2C01_064381 [Portunus trituberculatus]|uniref:Uncharacterized protein n=1 Tax=Portunus trituberculatus TaxID=210409 RepID=A0A5B7HG20_PORTR|nr:hypothetical protein [Portunus trituberculatus]
MQPRSACQSLQHILTENSIFSTILLLSCLLRSFSLSFLSFQSSTWPNSCVTCKPTPPSPPPPFHFSTLSSSASLSATPSLPLLPGRHITRFSSPVFHNLPRDPETRRQWR